jgi:toxin secretion/phage lysis holin
MKENAMETIKELLDNFHFTNELWAVMIPIILMGIDILTGIINAWIKKELKSSKLREGLAKKFGEISIIVIGEIFVIGFGLSNFLADGISLYLIIMELISICENLEKIGVPVPKFIKNALAQTNEEINKDNKKQDDK